MESPSASPRRGRVPWQGLLLAVSLLTSNWILPTMAELRVEPVPSIAAEGMDVFFLVYDIPDNCLGFLWYKGDPEEESFYIATYSRSEGNITEEGPAYSNRHTIFHNGSLLIRGVIPEDTGNYTLEALDPRFKYHYAYGQLSVYHIQINDSKPIEGKELVLTCEPDIPGMTYQWYKDDQELQEIPDRLQLSSNNRILTLLNVTREDTGIYECEISNSTTVIFRNSHTLDVFYGPDTPTISPSEENYCSGTNLILFCEAASNPPAEYSWITNGQNEEPGQELHFLSISTSDSGSYTCQVHNSITDLSITAVQNITVHDPMAQPTIQVNNTTVTEKDILVLTCLTAESGLSIQWIFNSQILQLTERTQLSSDNGTLTIDPVEMEDEGEYQCEAQMGCSSRSDPISISVKALEREDTPLQPGAIAGIVIGAFIAVVLLCILAYFLYCSKTRRVSDQRHLKQYNPSASNHSQDQSDTSPTEIHEVTYSSLNFHVPQPKQSTPASLSPRATDTVYSEVRKK